MANTAKRKVDWPSWITASAVLGTIFCSIGGFLFNQRVLPKEKEVDDHFLRIEKETKEKFARIENQLKELEKEVEEKDEEREKESRKQLELLHSIDIQLVKFNVGFETMKIDIKELKEKK